MHIDRTDKEILKKASDRNDITLYLGAGVSVASGLPTWERLVLAMYFSSISEQKMKGWQPFSNYLYAIAEWYLQNETEPLEITARKLRRYLTDRADAPEFIESLHQNLYQHFLNKAGEPVSFDTYLIKEGNATLKAVGEFCDKGGVNTVITYNYDNLLEKILAYDGLHHQTIFRDTHDFIQEVLPVYHVHGFVPLDKNTDHSTFDEIIFTEDQYHTIARDPYHWSNLVQMKSMTNSIGIMIGLSMSDRNMRRLLDAIKNAPIETKNYAILQKPEPVMPELETLDEIHEKAKEYLNLFERSGIKSDRESGQVMFQKIGVKSDQPVSFGALGIKSPKRYQQEIAQIIDHVQKLNREQQEFVLKDLGITPIWYENHADIPDILNEIFN